MSATETRYGTAARSLRDELMLNAVGDLLADRAWARISMADVAAQAGVSRQTVYNAFGSREEIARAYVRREADVFLSAVEAMLQQNREEPAAAIEPAIEVFLAAAETHPLLRAVSTVDGDELLALITARNAPLVGEFGTRLSGSIQGIWTDVSADDADVLADTIVRLAISHAVLPAATTKRTARVIAQVLSPFVERALARGR